MAQQVMMFNPQTYDQRLVDVSATTMIDQLKEKGWRENPVLVAMYHPGQRLDKTVMKEQQAEWEAKGFFAEPTVAYHPEKGNRTVSKEHAKKLFSEGWFDSPAKFPKPSTINAEAGKTAPKRKEAA